MLGGNPTEGTKIRGKFFRVWMDIKTALGSNDLKTILNLCEYGEVHAIDTYKEVLANDLAHLSLTQIRMIRNHYTLIRSDHYRIKSMRYVLV